MRGEIRDEGDEKRFKEMGGGEMQEGEKKGLGFRERGCLKDPA